MALLRIIAKYGVLIRRMNLIVSCIIELSLKYDSIVCVDY